MSRINRRIFLARAGALAGAAVLPPALQGLVACNGPQVRRVGLGEGGYGPLAPSPECPELALPDGFHCLKLSTAGDLMEGGVPVLNAPDGMAAFEAPPPPPPPRPARRRRAPAPPRAPQRPPGTYIRLVRNHEIRDAPPPISRPSGKPALAYDPLGSGGTSTLEVRVNPDGSREKVREFLSLGGTIINCAGGPTPWGSWLSCEEITDGASKGWQREHGYVFEVPSAANEQVRAVPLQALGRFVHEAVAVDPRSGIIYQTEDRTFEAGNPDSPGAGFYRFVPPPLPGRAGDLSAGRLQMLAVRDRPNYSTIYGQRVGVPLRVDWVDIDDPDPADADRDPWAVFRQGFDKGAAVFQRLEGCWYGEGSVFFDSTSGGDAGAGQIWQYRPADPAGGQLQLLFESPSRAVLDGPDNLVFTPRGGLLVCEDGQGEQYVRGITPRGEIFDFAKNLADNTEFAGACLSPDGQTFFLNIFGDSRRRADGGYNHLGMTFAIWGPWERGAL